MWLYLALSVGTKKSKWLTSARLENLTEKQLQMDGSIKVGDRFEILIDFEHSECSFKFNGKTVQKTHTN